MDVIAYSDTLSTKVYRQIKVAILSCVLRPGQMINESELIQQYGVSKTPIRETLKLLTQERLVQSIPGMCYVVTPITVKDVGEIWEMRAILEEATAMRAASLATPAQLDDLEARVGDVFPVQTIEDLMRWYDQNTQFHLAIANISKNTRLVGALRSVLEEVNRFLLLDPEIPSDTAAWISQHQRIIAALRERDGVRATAVTLEYMSTSSPRIQQLVYPTN
ncbi:MAG: GntR family transcriptional regulator [Holophaga sp.]|nr:GntR family transcriptional regulator [Holophaga sp.]